MIQQIREVILDELANIVFSLYERAVRNKTVAVGVVNVTEDE